MTLPDSFYRKQHDSIQRSLARLSEKLKLLRDACPHLNVQKKARSDTGNWSRSDDRYWYDCTCPACGKHWTEDQ
ncbi:hypothetical protein BcepSauron_360 [Burkholderia phage BcepSauron]|uniref:Uncharacterized protein n=2 Tax=Sarumanvirus TaxID=2843450 RepID=A0A482MNP4_9CAUD|nr:hypothetical protein H1O16_gp357 [Burkholderia phage BcepSaruman]YP_009904738.1 hypothetical protein H1O17_gp360 [Burkholderia phage BcepSauron]QBQ74740.1 hypothetical protein BcepSauron_360 [Burkholderia phage BcepSauron]QBX06770.1 hypothetical protein BcepSaruman_357 [Burkholderia phage BcepSaruman]